MDMLLVLLGLSLLIAMVVGLIKPSLVIRWGEKRTRPRVLMVYGGLFVASFIILGMTGNGNSNTNSVKAVKTQKVDQVTPVSTPANMAPEMKYDNAQAKARISDWLGEHEFPGISKLSLDPGKPDNSLYETKGKKYHLFILNGLSRSVDILVDPYTGELFYHDIGVEPQPINKWYLDYKSSHKAAKANNNRIDEKSEWVEMPRGETVGYLPVITGVVKNISNKPYSATITFTLYDGQGNQLGTADASIQDLKPGSTWKFQAISNSNTATFNLKGISYHLW